MRRLFFSLAMMPIAFSCVAPLGIEDSACPCTDGWVCCEGGGVCVREADACQGYEPDGILPVYSEDVDVLLVVDNSASMGEPQHAVRQAAYALVTALTEENVNYPRRI